MSRVINRILFGFLSLIIAQSAVFALSSEYKNTLNKVELTKVNDGSYCVNVYTQKKFSEPVKVIKKSDLSYYILLPETKNNAARTISTNNGDIRNVTTNLYPYAGQELNNGYTKININTTKPINFSLNVKSSQVQTASAQSEKITLAQNNNSSAVKIKDEKIEKKNSVSSSQTAKSQPIKTQTTQNNQITLKQPIKQVQKPVQKPAQTKPQVQNKTAQKPKEVKQVTKTVEKPKTEQVKKVQTPQKIAQAPQKTAQSAPKTTQAPKKEEFETTKAAKIEDIVQKEVEKEKALNQTQEETQTETQNEVNFDTIDNNENIPTPNFDDIEEQIPSEFVEDKNIFSKIKNAISDMFLDYGLGFGDLILITIVAIFSFFTALVLLTKKSRPQARLRSKSDLMAKMDRPAPNRKVERPQINNIQQPQKPQEEENKGQYFVFDSNIKQTGFYDPATTVEQKNYELSSYDPDTNEDYKKEPLLYTNDQTQDDTDSEYDIIQKILKEDTNTEVAPDEFANNQETQQNNNAENQDEPQEEEQKKEENLEPFVCSKVEIAPERGFMCISYNNNINLMGYIFDDVFALHNFKQSELEDYDIKFRLSEKDGKGANFIVKVNDTKMLIRVTKSSMNLEVVM